MTLMWYELTDEESAKVEGKPLRPFAIALVPDEEQDEEQDGEGE